MSEQLTRRRLLALSGIGVVTGLAGCTGSDDSPNDDGTGTTDDSADGNGSETDQDGGGSGDDINYADSYVLEIELHEAGTPDISQTYHEGDRYTRTEFGDGEVIESYHIEGESYGIVDGNCIITDTPAAENSVPEIQNPQGVQEQLEPTETTTIDGNTVDVYEHPEEDARWYVDTETGYPVQFEMSVATVTFHSWGDTSPIEAPDGECIEI